MLFSTDEQQRHLRRRLTLVVSLFAFIVVCVFSLGSFRAMMLSSVRAYIQGEGYWSKSQKEAVISLIQYADSQSQADFQAYLAAIRVPLGDKFTRLEMNKPSPDLAIVVRGFINGKNDPADIPGMIRFYRWFHNVPNMRDTISAWTQADAELDQLTELADQLHAETFADHPNPERVAAIMEQIGECDSRLTLLEQKFSSSLVAGDLWTRDVLNALALGISLLLLLLGIAFSRFLLRNARRSEDKYRRLLNSASDAILILDYETGIVLEANVRAAELFAIPSTRLAGMPESDLFPRGEEHRYQESFRAELSSGDTHSVQLKILRNDGRSVDVDASVRLIDLDDTRQRVILAIFRDTSELKRLNRSLLALSRCNQELVRASKESELLEKICKIIVTAGGYRLAWVGIPRDDQEKSVRVAAHSDDPGGYLDSLAISWSDVPAGRCPAGTAIRSGEICIIRNIVEDVNFAPWTPLAVKNGILSVIALPLSDGESVIGSLNIYSGEQHIFDAEEVSLLRELATNLAYGMSTLRLRAARERAEKDFHSLQEQLRQAQKMESLGRLAGGIAHDFNNLLTVIRGYADLAIPAELNDVGAHELHRKITEIMKASDRARGLIGQLLAFSRKQILQPRVIDLNHTLLDLGAVLPRLIGEDIQLTIRPGANLHLVKADPNQIQQILLNLAVNARDAMPKGGTLTIQTANTYLPSSPNNGHGCERVLLTVSDTGSGIPSDVRARIFEPFFTTKEPGKGTGLGLAMVYGTMTQSGGHIEVDSEVSQGTTFKLFFPPTADILPDEDKENIPVFAEQATETILLVEDDPSVRDLVSEFLNYSGFRVIKAVNGIDGLEKAGAHTERIHLVITDIVMPGMGGPDLAEQLSLSHPETRILFMSGYTDDEVVRQQITDRRTQFIEKPFELKSLGMKIREVLRSS
jgi:two-component system, cell cycle sensor histidine kinase and response regulator CckA